MKPTVIRRRATALFFIYRRYREEGEHELVCRRPASGGEESILLDGDFEAEGKAYFSLGKSLHSPDHRWLAWSCDDNGDELHTIRWRDLSLGTDGADIVKNTDGAIVWTRDSRAFLYTRMNSDFRTAEVYLHEIGADPASDRLVFEERDPAWFVWLRASRSRRYAVITVGDHDCSECWLVDLANATAPVRKILPRRPGLRYDVEPGNDRLYMRTNADGAGDFKLVSAPLDALEITGMARRSAAHPRPDDLQRHGFCRLSGLAGARRLPSRLVVRSRAGEEHIIAFDQPCCHLRFEQNFDYDRPILRLSYSSLTEPEEIYDVDLATGERVLLKRQIIPTGHDPAAYASRLAFALASDGEKVPISMVWRKDRPPGPGPVLLYGYGAYGVALPNSFDETRFSPDRSRLCLRHCPCARRNRKRLGLV